MPYINPDQRQLLDVRGCAPQTPGDLNYLFTKLAIVYLFVRGESYQTYNDIIGALECCKQELYRRKITSYENEKMSLNGDVYYD